MVHLVTNGVYRFCEWVTRLAYLNLLWLAFSVAGLVVFGVMPSTIAMFTVARKWATEDQEIPIFKTFFETYKKEFKKANLLGLILVSILSIFYFDFMIFNLMKEASFITFILTSFLIVFVTLILFIFPVYVHYDIRFPQTFKYALIIGLSRPLHSMAMAAGVIGVTYLIFLHITVLLFFSGSLFAFMLTAIAVKAFKSIEKSGLKRQAA